MVVLELLAQLIVEIGLDLVLFLHIGELIHLFLESGLLRVIARYYRCEGASSVGEGYHSYEHHYNAAESLSGVKCGNIAIAYGHDGRDGEVDACNV